MILPGKLDLLADRFTPFVTPLTITGIDLSGAVFIAQVRDRKNGGTIRADLATVGSIATEGIKLVFTEDSLEEIAKIAAEVNRSMENIGARRLHTIMEKVLEDISFNGPDLKKKNIKIDAAYVRKQLDDVVRDQDLSRYIL